MSRPTLQVGDDDMTAAQMERVKELQERSERVLRDAEDEQKQIAELLDRVNQSRPHTVRVLRRAGYLK
jgi:hypothetical protein